MDCNVTSYYAWSLIDNYELGNGYILLFGINWVNFTNPADRRQTYSENKILGSLQNKGKRLT